MREAWRIHLRLVELRENETISQMSFALFIKRSRRAKAIWKCSLHA